MNANQSEQASPTQKNGTAHFLAVLLVGFYLPIAAVKLGLVPFAWRYPLLVVVAALMAGYVRHQGRTAGELGFRRDNLRESLLLNGGITVAFTLALLVLKTTGLLRPPAHWNWTLWYPFYVLVSSPLQEFLFRAVLFAEMNAAGLTRRTWQITLSAVTFAFVHVLWPDPLMWLVTLLMGVVWGVAYSRYPNWWGVTLSHAVLGAVAISVGLI